MQTKVVPGMLALETGSKPTRRRQWHSKTRSGCETCKTRRVKCTEERPICHKCEIGARACIYTDSPGWKEQFPHTLRPRPGANIASIGEAYEKRAIQFFHQRTVPMLAGFSSHTKHFWGFTVPQVAASQPSIRHMAIALASRQEKELVTSTSEVARLQHMEVKHYASSLSGLTSTPTLGDMEIVLLASFLFVGYGNLEEFEHQAAQHLVHHGSSLKILHERADHLRPSGHSEIIDELLQPMFARLELVCSMFMAPADLDDYLITVEPARPALPAKFENILQARRLYLQICCYRHHRTFREQPWNCISSGFLAVRELLLDWYHLVLAYQREVDSRSEAEKQRIAVMLSQFRLIFVTFIYSGRTDLHGGQDRLRPYQVKSVDVERVSIVYHLPARYLRLLPQLDWESEPLEDPLQVRLWPVADIISTTMHSVGISLTFQI